MKSKNRKIPLSIGLLVCGSLLAATSIICGCSAKATGNDAQKKVSSPPVPVVVAQAEAKDVPVELRNVGNVEAFATVTIRSQITGQITKIHFREGQEVKAGDLLFTIDPRPSEGALKQSQADLKRDQAQLVSVRLEFERAKKLLENGIGSRDDYDKAEAAFHALEATIMSDEAAVSRAKLQVEFTSIRSPIDGRTGNLMVKEGNIVKAPDDFLVTINQVHPIYITFSVPEQELPAIRQRMKASQLMVEGEVPGELGEPARGELAFIDNVVDTTTGRIKLKAVFANTNDVLWPGQFLQTKLILRTLNHATVVPDEAIQSSQTGDFVFVVKADSTVQKRPVVIGLSRRGTTVVENGVQAGETVVTDGQLRLKDGSPVTAQTQGGGQSAQIEGARAQ
jgi:membrane fusion protein, multidrug efflux system